LLRARRWGSVLRVRFAHRAQEAQTPRAATRPHQLGWTEPHPKSGRQYHHDLGLRRHEVPLPVL